MNAVDIPEDTMGTAQKRDFTVNETTFEDIFNVFFFVVDCQLERHENKVFEQARFLNPDRESSK